MFCKYLGDVNKDYTYIHTTKLPVQNSNNFSTIYFVQYHQEDKMTVES